MPKRRNKTPTTKTSMLRFYATLLVGIPKALLETSDHWWSLVQVGLLLCLIVPPATTFFTDFIGNNAWSISLASFGVLFLIGFLRSNHAAYVAIEKRALGAELEARTVRNSLEERIANLEEQRPVLNVRAVNGPLGEMFLEVTNQGEGAEFEAQIEIILGKECVSGVPSAAYTGCWERGAGPRTRLLQGQKDRLALGRTDISRNEPLVAAFEMRFYSHQVQTFGTYSSSPWFPSAPGQAKAPRFVLKVVISATPRLSDGPFIENYLVDAEKYPHLAVWDGR